MAEVAVGCYECHGQRPEQHADTFTHMDAFEIHPVVTPKDCQTCHSGGVVEGHFASLDTAIRETNAMTLASMKLMQKAWALKLADPTNPLDEPLEQKWVRQWLLYSSSVRYAAAMGGPDYASLKNGWWR